MKPKNKKKHISPEQAIRSKAWLDAEYKTFENTVKSAVCFVLSTAIIIFEKRGRTEKYIKDFIKEMIFMFDMPMFDDKRIDMTDQMKQQEQKYGFSYDDVVVHIESKAEFVKGVKDT